MYHTLFDGRYTATSVLPSPVKSPGTALRLRTSSVRPLLAMPPTVTMTAPDVAPAGIGTTMLFTDQFVGVDTVPSNVTVLVPFAAPKFAPVIVTVDPTRPDVGDTLV